MESPQAVEPRLVRHQVAAASCSRLPGMTSPSSAVERGRAAHLDGLAPRPARAPRACAAKSPCSARTPIRAPSPAPRLQQLGLGRASRSRSRPSPRPGRATPRARPSDRGSASSRGRSPAPRRAGSDDLKIPEPTNTASAPSCIISAASAGVAMPPAAKFGTGQLALSRHEPDELVGRAELLGLGHQLLGRRARSGGGSPPCTARMCRTASTMLPVPASPLVRIIAAPSPMRRSASPRSRQPQTNGTLERELVDVVLLVGRREHLALVDVVDAQRLEHLRLDEVADAALGHHRDRHRGHDLVDLRRIGTCARRRPPCGCPPARARAPSRPPRPASSAIRACSASVTSMITPPLSISARPVLSLSVPGRVSCRDHRAAS